MHKPGKKNLVYVILTIVTITMAAVSGCLKSSVSANSTTYTLPNTYYGKNIQRIFNNSCGSSYGSCHILGSAYGVNLSSYQNVMASYSSEYGRNVVLPGNPTVSPLINKIGPNPQYGYRMPYGMPPLSAAEIDTLVQWIKDGATAK